MLKIIGIAVLAMSLASCASSMSGEYVKGSGKTLIVSKAVWSDYQSYASKVSVANPGGFAVAVVNGVALADAYSWCPEGHCIGTSSTSWAMTNCHKISAGAECVLFAESSEILVSYKTEN